MGTEVFQCADHVELTDKENQSEITWNRNLTVFVKNPSHRTPSFEKLFLSITSRTLFITVVFVSASILFEEQRVWNGDCWFLIFLISTCSNENRFYTLSSSDLIARSVSVGEEFFWSFFDLAVVWFWQMFDLKRSLLSDCMGFRICVCLRINLSFNLLSGFRWWKNRSYDAFWALCRLRWVIWMSRFVDVFWKRFLY